MILIMAVLNTETILPHSCDEAFELFKTRFAKRYEGTEEEQAKVNFCKNYAELNNLIKTGNCEDCGLTGIMDENVKSLRSPGLLNHKIKIVAASPEQLQGRDCERYICAVRMQLGSEAKIYSSIDLREAGMLTPAKDEGTCGSCWAFGVTAVLESLILSDEERGLALEKPFWKYTPSNLSLSEQFIASNLWGFEEYCNGGNFITAVAGTVSNFSTFDLEKNYQNNFKGYYTDWLIHKTLNTKIDASNYYIPYHEFNESYGNVATIEIFDSQNSSIGEDPAARNLVKYFLSHGVAVASTLYAAPEITYYQGTTIIDIPCPGRDKIDHEVTIAGYGMKTDSNGVKKEVWVIRNSWGTNWGSDGYFYVEQGQNSLCSEMYFYTLMPKYMYSNESFVNPGVRRTGPKYLDPDTPILVAENFTRDNIPGIYGASTTPIVLCVSLGLVSLCVIAGALVCLRKARAVRNGRDEVQTFIETYL